jgi:hypothetical protein
MPCLLATQKAFILLERKRERFYSPLFIISNLNFSESTGYRVSLIYCRLESRYMVYFPIIIPLITPFNHKSGHKSIIRIVQKGRSTRRGSGIVES